MNTIGPPNSGASDPHYLAQGPSLYERKRQTQDKCMAWTFVLFFLATSLWGIAAIVKRNPHWADFSEDFMNNSTSCNINTYMAAVPSSGSTSTTDSANSFASAFSKSTVVWLPISAAVGIVFSIIFVVLYRRFAEFMVYSMVVLSIAMSYIFAIVALASGAIPFGIILLVMAAIVTCMYCLIWRQLKVAARLLAIAGRGLIDNPALVLSSIVTQVLGMGVLAYQFVTVYLAFSIGTPASYATRDESKTTGTEGTALCFDIYGQSVPCCQFNMEGWAVAFVVFEVMALYWTGMMVFSIKLYTVADTIAQWYFLPQEGAVPGQGGSVRLALRNCFSNSFGSLAFSSLVLAIIRYLRNALNNAAQDNLCCAIINCLVQPLLRLLEQFTQFCTIGCAITGQSFVHSARTIFDTLKRNFLPTYSMWWIPEMVMGMSAVLLALAWTAIVYFATWSRWKNNDAVDAVGVSFAVSAVCFVCTWFIIHFVASVLLDIVNTVYICFVLDLDNRRVTKPEIYEIFMMVPTIQGRVVENPDGNVAYGAPVQMAPTGGPPPQGYPPQGYPPQQGYAPQPQGYPAVAPQGYPPQRGPNYV